MSENSAYDYDVVVIGSGPAGQRAAIQAAKLEKRVAIVEKNSPLGGVCVLNGTIPSKTIREAIIYLTGYREHEVYGDSYVVKQRISMQDLIFRCDHVVRHEVDVITGQMIRNGIEMIRASASFVDGHKIRLIFSDHTGQRDITSEFFVITTGTIPARPDTIPFDGKTIIVADEVPLMTHIPRTLVIIGAGVIGLEYASMFATLGVRVTIIDQKPQLLDFVDREIVDALAYHLRSKDVVFRLGEVVETIMPSPDGNVNVKLTSGKLVGGEIAMYSVGRSGATTGLGLENVGLTTDNRGRIAVDHEYRTPVLHIFAAGDIIGFPSLAATSREQGRIAVCNAYGIKHGSNPEHFPYGIYTLPEISTVGKTEEALTEAGIPYEIGKANYREVSRGEIMGDVTGVLKLLFHRETREILGVHIIGEGASELIHIGQAVLALGGKLDYFLDAVFNYPTLGECYKTAAFDGVSRLVA